MSDRVEVRMACGCVEVLGGADDAPVCATHGERRVKAVKAPPPRIIAVNCEAEGPLVRKVNA